MSVSIVPIQGTTFIDLWFDDDQDYSKKFPQKKKQKKNALDKRKTGPV